MKTTFTREYLENSTPSRADGVDAVKEQQLRKTYFNFIKQLVKELKLLSWTLETATFFTHQYFAARSILKNDRFLVATAAVFVACKVCESPRSLRDVAYVFFKTKNANKREEMANLRTNTDAVLKPHMDNILLAERALLYTLAFDLKVDHPYADVVKCLKTLGITIDTVADTNIRTYIQTTTNMLNDSLMTTLCLQYESSKIAKAAMYLVDKRSVSYKLPIPEGTSFAEHFDISQSDLDDISAQIMSVYNRIPRSTAPAAAATTPTTPQPPAAIPSAEANDQQGPSSCPVSEPGQTTQNPPSGSTADAVDGAAQQAARSAIAAELPAAPSSSMPGPLAKLAATSAAADSNQAAAEVHASPLVDSDTEENIRHAPASGDQNNHNERDVPDMLVDRQAATAQQQMVMSRKRTRSPLPDGELERLPSKPKSPCLASA